MALSEEVNDEIEALNSIYGDGSLCPASAPPSSSSPSTSASDIFTNDTIFILTLPSQDAEDDTASSERTSLRLSFPSTYPASDPPKILATHSAGANAKPGAAAHALQLFRAAVEATFSPGAVCLFDAVEDFNVRLAESQPAAVEDPVHHDHDEEDVTLGSDQQQQYQPHHDEADLGPEPPWVLSDPLTELKSTFLARAACVSSPDQADSYISHLLATDKKARSATHNITAWRINCAPEDGKNAGGAGVVYQDCDDDGESAAGSRVLKLLQLMDVWNVMVVVTRWYGGQKLGPRRFAVINSVAREAVVRLTEDRSGNGGGDAGGGGVGGSKKKGGKKS